MGKIPRKKAKRRAAREKKTDISDAINEKQLDPVTTHLMVDIETTSVDPHYNAAITAIGLVVFSGQGVSTSQLVLLDPMWSPGARGQETYEWWMKQDADVRQRMFGGTTLPWHACDVMTGLIAQIQPRWVWGYPARFDVGHLRELYVACGKQFPMRFYQERDLSTLLWTVRALSPPLAKTLKEIKDRNSSAHDALADAENQALQVMRVFSEYPALETA